jgi:acetylornithine deacetylase/succinyl-diaminopimelate desuccinylase-like protein
MDATRQSLGIALTQGGGKLHGELVLLPGIEITGLSAGATDTKAANIIPTEAEVRLDMRLVKGDRIDRQLARLVRFVEGQGFASSTAPRPRRNGCRIRWSPKSSPALAMKRSAPRSTSRW